MRDIQLRVMGRNQKIFNAKIAAMLLHELIQSLGLKTENLKIKIKKRKLMLCWLARDAVVTERCRGDRDCTTCTQ